MWETSGLTGTVRAFWCGDNGCGIAKGMAGKSFVNNVWTEDHVAFTGKGWQKQFHPCYLVSGAEIWTEELLNYSTDMYRQWHKQMTHSAIHIGGSVVNLSVRHLVHMLFGSFPPSPWKQLLEAGHELSPRKSVLCTSYWHHVRLSSVQIILINNICIYQPNQSLLTGLILFKMTKASHCSEIILWHNNDSWDSVVAMLQAGQLTNCGLIPDRGKRYFSSPKHLYWLRSLPLSGYCGLFPQAMKWLEQ
jgi:hypothetical protein